MKYNELEGARQAAKILWSSVSHHVFVETFTRNEYSGVCRVCCAVQCGMAKYTRFKRQKKKISLSLHSFEFEQTRVSAMVIQIS
jgi:hypothetical protein